MFSPNGFFHPSNAPFIQLVSPSIFSFHFDWSLFSFHFPVFLTFFMSLFTCFFFLSSHRSNFYFPFSCFVSFIIVLPSFIFYSTLSSPTSFIFPPLALVILFFFFLPLCLLSSLSRLPFFSSLLLSPPFLPRPLPYLSSTSSTPLCALSYASSLFIL